MTATDLDLAALAFSAGAFAFALRGWLDARAFFCGPRKLIAAITDYLNVAAARMRDEAGPTEAPDEGEVRTVTRTTAPRDSAAMFR